MAKRKTPTEPVDPAVRVRELEDRLDALCEQMVAADEHLLRAVLDTSWAEIANARRVLRDAWLEHSGR